MSAFAMWSLTSPSRRACDTERAKGQVETSDGSARVPCATPMREIRAPLSPASLRPWCKSVLRQRQRGKALAPMGWFDGGSRLALDGTGYWSSQTIHGASCLHTVHRNGSLP